VGSQLTALVSFLCVSLWTHSCTRYLSKLSSPIAMCACSYAEITGHPRTHTNNTPTRLNNRARSSSSPERSPESAPAHTAAHTIARRTTRDTEKAEKLLGEATSCTHRRARCHAYAYACACACAHSRPVTHSSAQKAASRRFAIMRERAKVDRKPPPQQRAHIHRTHAHTDTCTARFGF